jgi:hypothetical protein
MLLGPDFNRCCWIVYDVIVSLTRIGVVLFGVVVILHLFAVLYSFLLFVCHILMIEFYNIFDDSKKKKLK